MVVVLPDPLGPRRPKISPLRICRSRALRATFFRRPQKSRYSLVRFRVSTTTSPAAVRAVWGRSATAVSAMPGDSRGPGEAGATGLGSCYARAGQWFARGPAGEGEL